MASPRLATYQPQDRDGFAKLVNDIHAEFGFSYNPDLDGDLDAPDAHYRHILVVKIDDIVVGSAALTASHAGVTTLKRMYLRPALRGQGWGSRLLTAATELATQDGCEQIELDTNDRQPAACRLYERAGFELLRRAGGTRYYVKNLT